MPQFSYKARRRSGEVVQGTLDVADRSATLAQIERLGLFPVAVDGAKGGKAAEPGKAKPASGGSVVLPPALRAAFQRQRPPRLQELATYTQQLANLLRSGMPLAVALNSMSHLESRGISTEVSRQLRQEVTEGRSLSDAMAQQPLIFSNLYVNMVRAGEQSGALEDVLRRLATHYERFAEVQAKVKSALMYPAMVVFFGVAIVIFFMTFLLPRFKEMLLGFNVELPITTRFLIGTSDLVAGYWWLLLLLGVTGVLLFRRYKESERGRRVLDSWKMNFPVIGRVVRLNLFGQFARTLSTLLQNGVPVLTSLKIAEQVMPNVILKEAIIRTREGVTDGKTLAQPLAQSRVFPQLMIDLLKIGEETGDVPAALQNVADTYESELGIALRVMMNLIEPVMIVVIAVGVGFLLLSLLQPMFALTSKISASK